MKSKIKIKETALLVIDVTNAWAHPICEIKKWKITFKKIRKMIPKLQKFIQDYQSAGGNIIYIKSVSWNKKYLAKNFIDFYKDPDVCFYSKNIYSDKIRKFSEEFYTLSPDKKDIVLEKNSYDAFVNPKLNKILKQKNIKYLIPTGVLGDGCVHATIQGGFSQGYNYLILKDLIETTDLPIRQKLIKIMREFYWPMLYGKTISTKSFFDFVEYKIKR